MPTLLKENLVLTVGVALPVLLMVLFFVAGRVSESVVADPQYSLVFATSYDERWSNQPWKIDVERGDLIIRFEPQAGQEARTYVKPAIYLWEHEARYATRLDIDLDSVVDGVVSDPELTRLNQRILSPTGESPDGYRFEESRRPGAGGLLGDVIGIGGSRGSYVVNKGSRSVPIEGGERFYQAQFVAWVER